MRSLTQPTKFLRNLSAIALLLLIETQNRDRPSQKIKKRSLSIGL
ncbi:MAG: hypothetical protein ACRC6M_17450 [Microcystaceae cyanobacterium]